jgi:hypothetical protein
VRIFLALVVLLIAASIFKIKENFVGLNSEGLAIVCETPDIPGCEREEEKVGLVGIDEKAHRFLADGTAAHSGAVVSGHTDVDALGLEGGIHTMNPDGLWTHLAWKDGKNYLRGDTEVDGNLSMNKNVNVGSKVFFGDPSMSTRLDMDKNNTDSYYLEKVIKGKDNSSLRLTINDNADESFEIHGNSCGSPGGCPGPGTKAHRFRADGSAAHRGAVVSSAPLNPDGSWTHLSWKDGKNYLSGDTNIVGKLCIGSTCVDERHLAFLAKSYDARA